MCSYVDLTNVPVGGFTADKDITCYKVLTMYSNLLKSPFNNFYYKTGWTTPECQVDLSCEKVLYTVLYCPITKMLEKHLVVETLLRSFLRTGMKSAGVKDSGLAETTTGYYSFTGYMNGEMEKFVKYMRYQHSRYSVIVRCTIPKGSRYYVADNSETFISDRLKVEGIVKGFDI